MNMKNPHIIWASVAIIFMLLGAITALAALEKSTEAILTVIVAVAVPVLAGFGAVFNQKIDKVQDQVNGNNSRLLTQVLLAHQQSVELAKQAPPDPVNDGSNDGTTTVTTTTRTEPS